MSWFERFCQKDLRNISGHESTADVSKNSLITQAGLNTWNVHMLKQSMFRRVSLDLWSNGFHLRNQGYKNR